MTQIIGFAGTMGTGKTTQMRFLHGYFMKNLIPNPADISKCLISNYQIDNLGNLSVEAKFEDGMGYGEFDVRSKDPEMMDFLDQAVWPYIKGYSVADTLKEMAVQLFDIPEKCVYGTQEDKLLPVEHLRWENMPGVVTPEQVASLMGQQNPSLESLKKLRDILDGDPKGGTIDLIWGPDAEFIQYIEGTLGVVVHEEGPMSGRSFQQYVGTEVFRKMYSVFHINSMMKKIRADNPLYAAVDDIRFENELEAVKEKGGYVLYMDRGLDGGTHASERSLDKSRCNAILDLKGKTVGESCMMVLKQLQGDGVIPEVGDLS